MGVCLRALERVCAWRACWPLTPFSAMFQAKDLNFEIEKLEIQINNLNIDRYFVCCGCGLCDALTPRGRLNHTRFDRRWCCYRVLRAFLREEVAEAKLYTVKLQVFSRADYPLLQFSHRIVLRAYAKEYLDACTCRTTSRICVRVNANACLYRRYWT